MPRLFSILIAAILALSAAFGGFAADFLQPLPAFAQTISDAVNQRQADLQRQLDQLNQEIAAQQTILQDKQRESVSLERDVAVLDAKIQEAKLSIQASNIILQTLGQSITSKSATIQSLAGHISSDQDSIADIIRKKSQIESTSLTEFLLSSQSFTSMFSLADAYDTLNQSLSDKLSELSDAKKLTQDQKSQLVDKQTAEAHARQVIVEKQQQIQQSQKQKASLLSLSKQQEKNYQQVIADRQKQADAIRTALFYLRDSAAIPFGSALQYATVAYKKTGVPPAFLLAILTQETNLGQNVGTCNRPGDPASKGWKVIMKPDRDQGPYLQITSALGLDPDTMPLSCPWNGGWGGAMGPSQFIPSTWQGYANRVGAAVGKATPNPWDPQDAFMAAAIYLGDLGAGAGTVTAERTAALKYYAGTNWNKKANAFYGDQVVARATSIQQNMIDPLQGIGSLASGN